MCVVQKLQPRLHDQPGVPRRRLLLLQISRRAEVVELSSMKQFNAVDSVDKSNWFHESDVRISKE